MVCPTCMQADWTGMHYKWEVELYIMQQPKYINECTCSTYNIYMFVYVYMCDCMYAWRSYVPLPRCICTITWPGEGHSSHETWKCLAINPSTFEAFSWCTLLTLRSSTCMVFPTGWNWIQIKGTALSAIYVHIQLAAWRHTCDVYMHSRLCKLYTIFCTL